MKVLNEIWQAIAPYCTATAILGFLSTLITVLIKALINRKINALNLEEAEKKAVEQGIEQVKQISFTQTLQPIANSELMKITENANRYMEDCLKDVYGKLDKIIEIQAKQASYFDGSIAVSDKTKEEMKELIAQALNKPLTEQTIKVEQVIEENKNDNSNTIEQSSPTGNNEQIKVVR